MSVVKDSLKAKFRLSDTILRPGGHRMDIGRCLIRSKGRCIWGKRRLTDDR